MRLSLSALVMVMGMQTVHAQQESGDALAPAVPPATEQDPETPPEQQPEQPPGVQPAPEAPVVQAGVQAGVQQAEPVFEEAGPAGAPQAPPGYGTPPPTYGQPTVGQPIPQVQLRQPQLDPASVAQIEALTQERNQIRVGGWIAMMAAGAATTAVSVLLAAAFAADEELATGCDRCGDNPGTIGFSVTAIVTAAVALTGFLMFLRRVRARGALSRQIRDIRMRELALLEW